MTNSTSLALLLMAACSTAGAADLIEPPLVAIQGGVFAMGSGVSTSGKTLPAELPVHDVTIKPFRLSKYEVTIGQFRQFIEATAYKPEQRCWRRAATEWGMESVPGSWDTPAYTPSEYHPVTCVSWLDAKAYIAWLAGKTGKPYRLPSEAEWEYAARAGSRTAFHFGDDERNACRYGNVLDKTGSVMIARLSGKAPGETLCDDGADFTSVVGSYEANAFGLHDMVGNLSEYVEDCEHLNYDGAPTDGSAWVTACAKPMKVRRGGGYGSRDELRSAARAHAGVDNASSMGEGFRIALEGSGDIKAPPATLRFEAALKAAIAKARPAR